MVTILMGTLAISLLMGCAVGASPDATPSAHSPTPTATMPPLPGVTPDAQIRQACPRETGSPLGIADVQVGAYDSWQELPADLPLKPEPVSVAKVVGNLALNQVTVDVAPKPPANAAPGHICAATVRVVSFELLPGSPNVTRSCSDHAYLVPGGPDYGGDCGFTTAPAATAAIILPASALGTTVSVPVANAAAPGQPAAIPPVDGSSPRVWLSLRVPASGRYGFVVGLWQDASGPSLTAAVSEVFDVNVAHEWNGQNCVSPQMQAQLPPPTDPPTPVFCPGGPPPPQ